MPTITETTPELGPHDHVEWSGFRIKRKRDFPSDSRVVGYVVVKSGCNVIPGAAWFRSIADAKKGIAAFVLACRVAPRPSMVEGVDECDGDIFWMFMELTR